MTATAPVLALRHFDALYSRVFGRSWPSVRLGLLTPKKHCLISNAFLKPEERDANSDTNELAIDLARYYRRHLLVYRRNRRVNDRPLATLSNSLEEKGETEPDQLEDGLSSAEDLIQMFSDRRMDDDEKYFINRASKYLSLNDYVPATELISKERFTSDQDYYRAYDTELELDVERIEEPPFEFSTELSILTFPRNNWSRFDEPNLNNRGNLMSHFLLDGGSILPILALDLQLDDECADYCAAPGGKSLAMLMTLRPKLLLCNDSSSARLGRMYTLFRQYLPDISYVRDTLRLCNRDATFLIQPDAFDKILVDVPCSNDRVSAEKLENNIFKRDRSEERQKLPDKQCDILTSALKSVRANGSVVYSTCTMSPVENDNVVQRALARLQMENHPARFAVVTLKEAFRPLRGLYNFYTKHNFGQLVMPSVLSNFGPMYISKIKRLS